MVGDKQIEYIEIGALPTVELDHPAIFHTQAGLWIERAIRNDQAGLGPGFDKGLAVDITLCKDFEATGMLHHRTLPSANIELRRSTVLARRTPGKSAS